METQTATLESETGDERRIAGIDRWTIGPALLVLALAVLMSVVLPWVDSETEYSDAVERGDVVQLADGITLVPAPGWNPGQRRARWRRCSLAEHRPDRARPRQRAVQRAHRALDERRRRCSHGSTRSTRTSAARRGAPRRRPAATP